MWNVYHRVWHSGNARREVVTIIAAAAGAVAVTVLSSSVPGPLSWSAQGWPQATWGVEQGSGRAS